MKKISLIFISLLILSCDQKEKKEPGKLLFSAKVDKWHKLGDLDLLSVKTTLTNTTADTVKYISMSCSWQDAYTTDTNDLSVMSNPCGKNVPKLIELPPNKSEEINLDLATKKNIDQLRNLKFRVGFNLVTAKDYNEMFDKVSELGQMKNVIWSDTLHLN